MTKQAKTKDENFMLHLYEEALKLPDMQDPLDRYEVGLAAGLQPRAVNAICNLLIRANFIKKKGQQDIFITPHGVKLAQELRQRFS